MLEALPLDIVYQICDWLVRDDIQALALTCRTIAQQTKPHRFPSVRITNVDPTLLETLESDPGLASAVREVILDLPAEFDPYAPKVPDEMLSKYIQRLFNLAVHLSTVAWTSPRAPSNAALDIIATHGVRNIAFSQQQRWHNIDTALRKALCEMKLNSFCHLQGEKFIKTSPLGEPFSPRADLKELSLSYTPTWLKLPHEPLALEIIILRHVDDGTTFLPNLLNSKHLTCIILHIQAISDAVSLNQWLEESPVYPSLRTFCFAVKTEQWDMSETFLSAKLLPFLANHTFLTYLDIDIHVDDDLEGFAAILRQMKLLDFLGFATRVGQEWILPHDENLFEYLSPLLSALPSRLGGLEIGTWYWLTPRRESRQAYYRALARQFPYLNYFLAPPISINCSVTEYPREARVIAEEMKCLEWIQGGRWTYRVVRQHSNSLDSGREVKDIVLWGKQVRHPWNPKEPRKSKLFE